MIIIKFPQAIKDPAEGDVHLLKSGKVFVHDGRLHMEYRQNAETKKLYLEK